MKLAKNSTRFQKRQRRHFEFKNPLPIFGMFHVKHFANELHEAKPAASDTGSVCTSPRGGSLFAVALAASPTSAAVRIANGECNSL